MFSTRPVSRRRRDRRDRHGARGVAVCHGADAWAGANWYNLADSCLERLACNGLPVAVEEAAPDVLLVNSRAVESLAEADLARVFAGTALMDPAAFEALAKRFPGLKFTKKLEVASLAGERALATSVRASGYEKFAEFGQCEKVRALLYPRAADVVRFSEMTVDPKACGTCVVPTEFGGRAVVVQDVDGNWPHPCWPGCRRRAILNALDAAVPGGMPARLLTDGYAVSVAVRKTLDGKTAGVYLQNLGAGETPPLELAIRRGADKNWRVMLPTRSAGAVEQRQNGSETILRLPPLRACEPVLVQKR